MKIISIKTLLFPFLCYLTSNVAVAQEWNWNGRTSNEKIQEYIWGTIQDMDDIKDCTNYSYGKSKYQKIDVNSYSFTTNQVHFEFRFSWRIDYWVGGHENFSFKVKVSASKDGCNARATYLDESGRPDCRCDIGDTFNLGCVYFN